MQRLLFITGAVLWALTCSSQSFTKVYSAGNTFIQFNNITLTSGGGWYAAGYARVNTGYDAFISKYDEIGNLLWSKKPENTRDPRALVTLNDGSVLLFNNNSGFQSYFDASVLHLNADGGFVSEMIWGAPNDQDDWFGAQKLNNGEVLAIGMSRKESEISERILLAKFLADGQILWEKTYDAGFFGRFNKILPLPSGEFYALGRSYPFGGLLGKFSENGDLQWLKTYNLSTVGTYFQAGQVFADGSLLVAAYLSTLGTGEPSLNLLNIDANGEVTNQHLLQNNYDLGVMKMALLNSDTVLIAAISNSQDFPAVDNDNVVLKVSPQGDLLGSLAFGTSASEIGFDAFFTDRHVLICGFVDTSADGTARRGYISKSGIDFSCCEKNIVIEEKAPPPLPAVSEINFTNSSIPVKQSQVIFLSDLTLSETVSCQSLDTFKAFKSDTTICNGDTLTLGIPQNIPADILWNTGATTPEILVDAPGTYTIQLSGECGTSNDTIQVVSIGNRVNLQVEAVTSTCAGESVTLSASGGSNFIWYNMDGFIAYTTANPVITPLESTSYLVEVFDGQCKDTATVAVNVWPAPPVTAGQDITIKSGAQVRLSASGASNYTWSPETGLSCVECPNPVLFPDTTSDFIVTGTDANGCSASDTITVDVIQPCPFYIPNAFKPESETNNNAFGVFSPTLQAEGFLLRIYSRWGELVFESTNPQISWQGQYEGNMAQSGVYVYQLEMNTCGEQVKKSGTFTLIR